MASNLTNGELVVVVPVTADDLATVLAEDRQLWREKASGYEGVSVSVSEGNHTSIIFVLSQHVFSLAFACMSSVPCALR